MKPARQDLPPPSRQMTMALDRTDLRGMTAAERAVAVGALASVLLEAAGISAREAHDDRG